MEGEVAPWGAAAAVEANLATYSRVVNQETFAAASEGVKRVRDVEAPEGLEVVESFPETERLLILQLSAPTSESGLSTR